MADEKCWSVPPELAGRLVVNIEDSIEIQKWLNEIKRIVKESKDNADPEK